MMNFKNNDGFTLTEVLLAVAIIGLVLTPIFITQSTLLQSVSRISRRMARVFFAKQFLIESTSVMQLKQKDKEDPSITIEKVDDPETVVMYKVQKLPKNSVFSQFPDLYLKSTTAKWQRDGIEQEQTLISFMFQPEPPEKKERNMQRGFMLIEVLIASLISAIFGVILFAAYYQSNRVTRSIDDFIDVYSREALLQHQLERDIFGAFIPEQAKAKENAIENIFVSTNKDGTFDMLTFITNNPLTTYGGSKPRIVRVVYRLKPDKVNDHEKNSYTLFRQESINLDLKAFKLSDTLDAKSIRTYEVADGIKSFKIEHTAIVPKEDKIELEKKDVWHSDSPPTSEGSAVELATASIGISSQQEKEKGDKSDFSKDSAGKKEIALPQVVTFFITLWDLQKERERSFVISVPIFVGSIDKDEMEEKIKARKEKQVQQQNQKKQTQKQLQMQNFAPVGTKQSIVQNKKRQHNIMINGKQLGDNILLEKQTVVVGGGKSPVGMKRKLVQVSA